MHLSISAALGPLRVAVALGEPEGEALDDDEMPADVVGELVRLGADTAVFGFTPDPAFRDLTGGAGWEEETR